MTRTISRIWNVPLQVWRSPSVDRGHSSNSLSWSRHRLNTLLQHRVCCISHGFTETGPHVSRLDWRWSPQSHKLQTSAAIEPSQASGTFKGVSDEKICHGVVLSRCDHSGARRHSRIGDWPDQRTQIKQHHSASRHDAQHAQRTAGSVQRPRRI